MTKVEELRADIITHLNCIDPHELVGSLIAAARQEGAATEREKIRQNWIQRGYENKSPDDGTIYRNIDEDSLFGINRAPKEREP